MNQINLCDIPECRRKWRSSVTRLCSLHGDRLRHTGDPYGTTRCPPGLSIEEKLMWHGWDIQDNGCWVFRGRKNKQGYGQVKHDGRYEGAHRWAFRAWVGEIPQDKLIRHSCDNPPCINPKHLLLGTIADNMNDAVERGSFERRIMPDNSGELNPMSKLTNAQREEARNRYRNGEKVRALANEYGMSYGGMWTVVTKYKEVVDLESDES